MRKTILFVATAVIASLSANPIKGNLGGEGTKYSGVKGYTPADYVQDGLIAMWDGELNSVDRDGNPCHDANAAVWSSLKGDIGIAIDAGGSWGEKSLDGDGTYRLGVFSNRNIPLQTVEVCFKTRATGVQFVYLNCYRRNCIGVSNTDVGVGLRQGKALGYSAVGKLMSVTAIYGGTTDADNLASEAFSNDILLTSAGTTGANWSAPAGTQAVLGSAYSATDRCFEGSIFSIRMYSRALTVGEIAQNRKVDVGRFE